MPEESEETKAARLESEQKSRQTVAKLCSEIEAVLKNLGKDMTAEEKRSLVSNTVVPIVGQANFKMCTDKVKLQALLDALKQQ